MFESIETARFPRVAHTNIRINEWFLFTHKQFLLFFFFFFLFVCLSVYLFRPFSLRIAYTLSETAPAPVVRMYEAAISPS